ncbi:relaxase/mobilization nuclease domain-containing protein [Marinifilum flexuosum]|uniref:Relaxase/mobilization nuclease-like protein n=1 Tax=Marinifilum flexuosum TaxID=1117708 RepID=A0A419WWD7_9BACT|nr:relaxase/mobilization nuclease domain-containing protein [Marinifilum flexuosum]RKD99770.1 relaxase/mobilization nuclease-like protein [Marinifilum flexuosum]
MIAKIVKGKGFAGVVNYILDQKKGTELLNSEGLRLKNKGAIVESFKQQAELNSKISKPGYHISLSFSAKDKEFLSNELMADIAKQYMSRMKIFNTQFLIARHFDKEHPHIHLIINRVDYHGKTISDKNDRIRSEKICKELTRKHCLYFAKGKEQVKVNRLHEPDKTKYEIYDALKMHISKCSDWSELIENLRQVGIQVDFKTKGNTMEIQGVRFTKGGLTFNGSKVDRQFSFSKIDARLQKNQQEISRDGTKALMSTRDLLREILIQSELTNQYSKEENRKKPKVKRKSAKRGFRI